MLNIRVIGWSAHTDQTIDELIQSETWQKAVERALANYGGELQFVVALDENQAPTDLGFCPLGRWETMPLKPDSWRNMSSVKSKFSIMGFDHSKLLPVLEYWEAPSWTMAAQKSLHQHQNSEYRFIAAFSGHIREKAVLGYFTPQLADALSPPDLPGVERSA